MKRIIYSSVLAAVITLSSGCGKDWLSSLGTNPNQPSEAPASLLLPPVLSSLASWELSFNNPVGAWMGYTSFSGGYSINDNTLTYYVNSGSPSNWGLYGVLKNADYIIQQGVGENGENSNFVAAAKILKSFGFQYLVDAYNNVPYSEAFRGVGNFFPSYDKGEDVYKDCIAQLDSAIALIQNAPATANSIASSDVMFGGNMDKWLRFANTVKLKFLIRSSANPVADAKAELSKTAAIGFLEGDANVNPGYLNTAGKQSPLWASFGADPGGSLYSDGYNFIRGGGAAVEFYKGNNDPRLFYVFAPDGSAPNKSEFFDVDDDPSHYHGVFYGDRAAAASQNNGGTVGIGHGVMNDYDNSVALISAAQSYFLQAEAALKGWTGGDAQALYEKGITASFQSLGVKDAESAAKTYYSQNKDLVSWTGSSNKLKAIITQKWAANAILHSFVSWSEYRRTGYPDANTLPASKFPGYSRHIPTIWWYPQSESQTNQANYNAALGGDGSIDTQNDKVFWDK